MPRRRRHEKISSFHLGEIERDIGRLQIRLIEAQTSLTPFREHYDAVSDLQQFLTMTLNLLNDRPADYREPHRAPFSGG